MLARDRIFFWISGVFPILYCFAHLGYKVKKVSPSIVRESVLFSFKRKSIAMIFSQPIVEKRTLAVVIDFIPSTYRFSPLIGYNGIS